MLKSHLKKKKLHIPLDLTKVTLPPTSPIVKNENSLYIKEQPNSSPSRPLDRLSAESIFKSALYRMKSERNLMKLIEQKEEEDKESEINKTNIEIQPISRKNLRAQTSISDNGVGLIASPSHFIKDDKKLSFSVMESSKILAMKKDNKELNAFKFINYMRKNREKSYQKFSKNSKPMAGSNEFNMKNVENNYKMDKSSLFFRNQLINMSKMQNLEPVEQMIWAIKHNNIHKVLLNFSF